MIPTVAWDEAFPPESQAFSLGDDRIRELKTQFREIFEVDHEIESSGSGDNWGYHKKTELIERSEDPAIDSNLITLFTKEVDSYCELHMINSTGSVMQLTSNGDYIGGMSSEIRMWSGLLANIPTGWKLCNGLGSPNLIGRFVQGIATRTRNPLNDYIGGDEEVSLSNTYYHNHTIVQSGNHNHAVTYVYGGIGSHRGARIFHTGGSNIQLHTKTYFKTRHSHTLNSSGGGEPFNILPPYLELAFIMRS